MPVVAEKLEKLRSKILILCYQLPYIRAGQAKYVEATIPLGELRYDIGKERLIKGGFNERQERMAEIESVCENKIKFDCRKQ